MNKTFTSVVSIAILLMFSLLLGGCSKHNEPDWVIPDCEQVVIFHVNITDSLVNNPWYDFEVKTLEFVNSAGKKIVYKRQSGPPKSKIIYDECDFTQSSDLYSANFASETISPSISIQTSNRRHDGAKGLWFVPEINIKIGASFSCLIRLDSNIASAPFTSKYFDSLDTLDGHFKHCYIFSREVNNETDIQGIIYSSSQGFMGYYRQDGVYLKRK